MKALKEKKSFGPKQVGERIRERRTELKLSMPELGKRLGVNKSTIQRYEADGVDPKRTMIIDGLAHALLTTPEWLTGLSEDKEYTSYTVCQMDLEKHVKDYLETLTASVKGEPHQQLLTTFLGQLVDLYAVLTKNLDQGVKNRLFPPVDSQGKGLHNQNIGILVHHNPREKIRLPENHSAAGSVNRLPAVVPCLQNTFSEKILIDFSMFIPGQHADHQ